MSRPPGLRQYTRGVHVFVPLLVAAVVAALPLGGSAAAQGKATLRDLKNPDFEKANAALGALAEVKAPRPQIVAGLLDALKTGRWNRCGGDMRDGIARTLAEWQVKAAVPALLELVRSGKSIEHECSE